MATSLRTRFEHLEGGAEGGCPGCGFDGDWSKVRTVFEDAGDGPKNCGTCGRALRIMLSWGERS